MLRRRCWIAASGCFCNYQQHNQRRRQLQLRSRNLVASPVADPLDQRLILSNLTGCKEVVGRCLCEASSAKSSTSRDMLNKPSSGPPSPPPPGKNGCCSSLPRPFLLAMTSLTTRKMMNRKTARVSCRSRIDRDLATHKPQLCKR